MPLVVSAAHSTDGTRRSRCSTRISAKRRFFYTHVLGIGGRRTETDFMRMHEARGRSCARSFATASTCGRRSSSARSRWNRRCDDHGLDGPVNFAELRACGGSRS